MARSKNMYTIKVHYPETEEGMYEIRRRMGTAYVQFVRDYILALPVCDEEKNMLYANVTEHLTNIA